MKFEDEDGDVFEIGTGLHGVFVDAPGSVYLTEEQCIEAGRELLRLGGEQVNWPDWNCGRGSLYWEVDKPNDRIRWRWSDEVEPIEWQSREDLEKDAGDGDIMDAALSALGEPVCVEDKPDLAKEMNLRWSGDRVVGDIDGASIGYNHDLGRDSWGTGRRDITEAHRQAVFAFYDAGKPKPRTNADLKVGDRVMLSEDHTWVHCDGNPLSTHGTVTLVDWRVYVDWDNGKHNSYRSKDSDLIPVSEEPKKVTEQNFEVSVGLDIVSKPQGDTETLLLGLYRSGETGKLLHLAQCLDALQAAKEMARG